MKLTHGLMLAVGVALVLAAAIGFFASRPPPVSLTPIAPGATHAPSVTQKAAAPAPQVSPAALVAAQSGAMSASGKLAQQVSRSTNLRRFVEFAKQRPEEGGVTYAVAALQYCQHWSQLRDRYSSLSAEVARSPGPTAAQRLEALNRMSAQCADFTSDELGQALALRASGKASDPILSLQGQWFDYPKLSSESQRELVAATLGTRDPYLLNAVGSTIGQKVVDGQAIVEFDGERFGGVATAADYRAAWSLVACNFGEDCTVSADVTTLCVFEGLCFSNRATLLQAQYVGRDTEFARVVALSERLTDAVRSGAAERFFKPVSGR